MKFQAINFLCWHCAWILFLELQSEKRKQDLLAEMLLEEQRGRELSKIMKELLPDPKDLVAVENPSRVRKVTSLAGLSK